jgi:hypothetical protein
LTDDRAETTQNLLKEIFKPKIVDIGDSDSSMEISSKQEIEKPPNPAQKPRRKPGPKPTQPKKKPGRKPKSNSKKPRKSVTRKKVTPPATEQKLPEPTPPQPEKIFQNEIETAVNCSNIEDLMKAIGTLVVDTKSPDEIAQKNSPAKIPDAEPDMEPTFQIQPVVKSEEPMKPSIQKELKKMWSDLTSLREIGLVKSFGICDVPGNVKPKLDQGLSDKKNVKEDFFEGNEPRDDSEFQNLVKYNDLGDQTPVCLQKLDLRPPVGANDPIAFESNVPDWYQNSSSRRAQKIAEDRDAERSFDELAEKISEKISSSLEKILQDSQKKILESQSSELKPNPPPNPATPRPKEKFHPKTPQPCTKTSRKSTLPIKPPKLFLENTFFGPNKDFENSDSIKSSKTNPKNPKDQAKSILKKETKFSLAEEVES